MGSMLQMAQHDPRTTYKEAVKKDKGLTSLLKGNTSRRTANYNILNSNKLNSGAHVATETNN